MTMIKGIAASNGIAIAKAYKLVMPDLTVTRTTVEDVEKEIQVFEAAMAEGNLEVAKEKLVLAEKKLMQAAAKGTISKHAASRKVSRLTKRFNAAKAAK